MRLWIDHAASSVRSRLLAVYGVVGVLTLGGWLWAVAAFQGKPALLGIALMIYAMGLRHAVDAARTHESRAKSAFHDRSGADWALNGDRSL